MIQGRNIIDTYLFAGGKLYIQMVFKVQTIETDPTAHLLLFIFYLFISIWNDYENDMIVIVHLTFISSSFSGLTVILLAVFQ